MQKQFASDLSLLIGVSFVALEYIQIYLIRISSSSDLSSFLTREAGKAFPYSMGEINEPYIQADDW